jgi:hypothetical protein
VDKLAVGQVLLRVLLFYPLGIIPTKLHTQLHLRVPVNRINGRSLGTFNKVKFFREWGSIGYKQIHTFTFTVLKGLTAGGPFIFTIQNVSCHRLSTPIVYFVLSLDNSNHFRDVPVPVRDTLVRNVSCLRTP